MKPKMCDRFTLLFFQMRFLDCREGRKDPSKSILDVGVKEAIRFSGFDEKMFLMRGGKYVWSKADMKLEWWKSPTPFRFTFCSVLIWMLLPLSYILFVFTEEFFKYVQFIHLLVLITVSQLYILSLYLYIIILEIKKYFCRKSVWFYFASMQHLIIGKGKQPEGSGVMQMKCHLFCR